MYVLIHTSYIKSFDNSCYNENKNKIHNNNSNIKQLTHVILHLYHKYLFDIDIEHNMKLLHPFIIYLISGIKISFINNGLVA